MKTKSPIIIAAALLAAFTFALPIPEAAAVPPGKVPGTGYHNVKFNKNDKRPQSCCKASRACGAIEKCTKLCRNSKSTSPQKKSGSKVRTPYWKRKLR